MSLSLGIAQWLAVHELHVFPLRPYGKRPYRNCDRCRNGACQPEICPCLNADLPCHGLLAGTVDARQIQRWWTRTPDANVGVNCGRSGLVVVDLDRKDKPAAPAAGDVPTPVSNGLDAFAAIAAAEGRSWPQTFTVATPTGGRHLYFRSPADVLIPSDGSGRFGHQVDIRAEGGYVVAPGGHIQPPLEDVQGDYTRVSATTGIAALPDWVLRRARPAEPAVSSAHISWMAPQPEQHPTAYWQRIWDGELSKVELQDGERWRLLYNSARRLANLARHAGAPWAEHQVIAALTEAGIRRRRRTGKRAEPVAARRNAERGWQRGLRDGPECLALR